LKDLEQIKKHLPHLELEVFVHGSMCFAYSGRCLISSVQSGRVSNRGSCANDCRFPYTLYAHNEESGTLFRVEESEEGTHIMNAKDLNLSAHVKEILDSGVIDSLKIEGRTKSSYYVGITTKTYRNAIEDYYTHCFDATKYGAELDTTKNRGFTDGYLVNRPYEKNDTQNLAHSISEGTHQVVAQVDEDGLTCLCKDVLHTGVWYELVVPSHAQVSEIENALGAIILKEGRWYVNFKILQTLSGKQFDAIHSGNTHAIELPVRLPGFTFLRVHVKDKQ
jgi:putative protease